MKRKEQKQAAKAEGRPQHILPREAAAQFAATADRFSFSWEKPIPGKIYPVLDTDLARDNLENDLPAADRNEL